MQTNYSLLFYLKKPKNYKGGPIPIYLRITVDGDAKEVSTGRQCDPERWCSKASRENGTKESTKLLNCYLDELERKVEEAHTFLTKERKDITATSLRSKYKGEDEKKPQIVEIFQLNNDTIKELLGIDYVSKHGRPTIPRLGT